MEDFSIPFTTYERMGNSLSRIIRLLSKEPFKSMVEPELLDELRSIEHIIFRSRLSSKPISFSDTISVELSSILIELRRFSIDIKSDSEQDFVKEKFNDILKKLSKTINKLKKELFSELYTRPTVYNSENYYKEQIKQLEAQKKSLEEEFKKKQKESKINQEEKEDALRNAEEQIRNYKSELEEKKKQENAISERRNKIKKTFEELSCYLSPIKDEHERLKFLYKAYVRLTGIVIIFIVVLEIIICCKFSSTESFPNWKDHLTLLLPIPASGALLWAFISQLNRAQRQLVLLAKHIHEIEYTEGLLLSLNSLSIDMEDSMKRVNSAIDRLLDNHLSMGIEVCRCDEDSIVKEEKKDMVPVDLILKLIKEAKGVVLS
jgi:hypothetical protein